MTKIEKEVRKREAEFLHDAIRDPADEQLYRDALRVLFDVALVLLGLLIGFHFGLSRANAATGRSIPPRCEYVGPMPGTPANAEEPPTTVTASALPDAPMVEAVGEPHEEWESLGVWKLSFYCPCRQCSGNWGHRTSSGATCQEGVTVACAILPAGTRIKIDGYGERIVQDTGADVRGRHLDVFMESHSECLKNGIQYREVWIKK